MGCEGHLGVSGSLTSAHLPAQLIRSLHGLLQSWGGLMLLSPACLQDPGVVVSWLAGAALGSLHKAGA